MRRCLAGALAACALSATLASAQSFSGQSSQQTEPFPLEPGVTAFGIEHIGDRAFRVELLDEQSVPVERLVDVVGSFSGVQAVEVERAGLYRFRVTASGSWSIQRRPGAGGAGTRERDAFVEGRDAGAAAAPNEWPWGWFARGLVGGTIAGPIGLGVAMTRAGRSTVDPPPPAESPDPRFALGFREGFETRLRERRREAAVAGGLVGTGAFLFVVLQVLDIGIFGGIGQEGGTPPPPPSASRH